MFQYFLPYNEPGQPTAQTLRAAGLGYAIDIETPNAISALRTAAGPDGIQGILLALGPGAAAAPYNAESQLWRKSADGKFWIGLPKTGPRPGPDELARSRIIHGEHIKLADGNEWIVPICHSIVRGTTLPKTLVLGEDGESWLTEELPEFVKLCQDARTVWEAFSSANEGRVSFRQHPQPG